MIPKIIHFAWFGGKMPEHTIKYINTWKECNSDYKIMLWNEDSFDLKSHTFARDAYIYKKWAFVADYIRFWALYNYGGIWLDTDVEVYRPFDSLLHLDYFIGNNSLNSYMDYSIIAARPYHPFVKLGYDEYSNRAFIDRNGALNCEFSPKSLIENVMNRAYAKHGIKMVVYDGELSKLLALQRNNKSILYVIDNKTLNSYYNTNNGICYACHHHEGTWIKGNRLNISEYSLEEVSAQYSTLGLKFQIIGGKNVHSTETPLLYIANTILCNYSMVYKPNLINGKMGICLFMYEYARYTNIKEYEYIADDMITSIISLLHEGQTDEDVGNIAAIGMGIIYLIIHEFIEDTDENDTLDAVDDFLFKKIEDMETLSETAVQSSLYFVYRCIYYRSNLDRNYCCSISKHILTIYQNKVRDEENLSLVEQYILDNVKIIYKKSQNANTFLFHLSPTSQNVACQVKPIKSFVEALWYGLILGIPVPSRTMSNSTISNVCQNCYYDAERNIGLLCGIGMVEMLRTRRANMKIFKNHAIRRSS